MREHDLTADRDFEGGSNRPGQADRDAGGVGRDRIGCKGAESLPAGSTGRRTARDTDAAPTTTSASPARSEGELGARVAGALGPLPPAAWARARHMADGRRRLRDRGCAAKTKRAPHRGQDARRWARATRPQTASTTSAASPAARGGRSVGTIMKAPKTPATMGGEESEDRPFLVDDESSPNTPQPAEPHAGGDHGRGQNQPVGAGSTSTRRSGRAPKPSARAGAAMPGRRCGSIRCRRSAGRRAPSSTC